MKDATRKKQEIFALLSSEFRWTGIIEILYYLKIQNVTKTSKHIERNATQI